MEKGRAYLLNKIKRLYTADIWASFFGEVMSGLSMGMVLPFLTLYLYEHLHIPLMSTMVVVSISPAAGLLSGVVAGSLADRFGRKTVMVLSLLGQASAMLLYGQARSVWEFCVVTAVAGMFDALYRPAVSARIADVVKEERRTEVFSFLHMGLNMGAATGPMIGAYLLQTKPVLLFDVAAICIAVTAVIIQVLVPGKLVRQNRSRLVQHTPARMPEAQSRHYLTRLREYGFIIVLTLLNLPVALLYAQTVTNLPIHLSHHFANYTHVLATIFTFNAVMVTLFQMVAARLVRNTAAWIVIAFSFLAYAVTGFGYAWAPSLGVLLVNEFIFTLGEMVGIPQLNHVVSVVAPTERRASYFSIFGLRWRLADLFGPLLGGWLMTSVGGANLFRTISLLILAGGTGTILIIHRKLSNSSQTQPDLVS